LLHQKRALKGELAERATPPVRAMEREMILEGPTGFVFKTFEWSVVLT
jgi:hypothetical protein